MRLPTGWGSNSMPRCPAGLLPGRTPPAIETTLKPPIRKFIMTETEIATDLASRAATIAEALRVAFGGRSQVGPRVLGRAVAGQINNNGLTVHGTLRGV